MSEISDMKADLFMNRKHLHELAQMLARTVTGCNKLQFAPYGQCDNCKNKAVCSTVQQILEDKL